MLIVNLIILLFSIKYLSKKYLDISEINFTKNKILNFYFSKSVKKIISQFFTKNVNKKN